MNNVPLFVAWRYLFARKSHNAINIVTAVSAAGIGIGTAAMICVLSVLNGFGSLVQDMFSAFNAQLRIESVEGKTFAVDTEVFNRLRNDPDVEVFSETVEENALVAFDGRQMSVVMKGVDDGFRRLTSIDSIMVGGTFVVSRGDGRYAVTGVGVAGQLGLGAMSGGVVDVYTPRRTARAGSLNPEKSFNVVSVQMAGTFSVQQLKYDDNYVLLSLDVVRQLLDYHDGLVSAAELRLKPGVNVQRVKHRIADELGNGFRVLDRYEQQADYFRIVRIEKWLTFLLLAFILLIASFSLIGSLSMLIIDKRDNIHIMRTMGADTPFVRRIFLYEGWLITALGALAGIVLGVTLCLLQQHFGFLHVGNGMDYIIRAYPVRLQFVDIVAVSAVVLLLGFVMSSLPVRRIKQSISTT